MKYAIKVLEDEKLSLELALKGWNSTEYKEAFKERERRLNGLNKALKIIKHKDDKKVVVNK